MIIINCKKMNQVEKRVQRKKKSINIQEIQVSKKRECSAKK
jgi:hypothetical protein